MGNIVQISEEKLLGQQFFLKDDENQSVEVEEIDFIEVKRRLKQEKMQSDKYKLD
jgi:hypothetical protein